MAPENAPSLVILDTRIENGDLRVRASTSSRKSREPVCELAGLLKASQKILLQSAVVSPISMRRTRTTTKGSTRYPSARTRSRPIWANIVTVGLRASMSGYPG